VSYIRRRICYKSAANDIKLIGQAVDQGRITVYNNLDLEFHRDPDPFATDVFAQL